MDLRSVFMNLPLISVIVPVYKVETYLDQCVLSILRQTYKNLEIILVDDGSPDSCPKMCDEYAKRDSRVKVIHKPNGGLSSARNAGMEIASGDFIGFVDSDDWIAPGMYEVLLDGFMQNEDVGITAVGRVLVDAEGKADASSYDVLENRHLTASEWVSLMVDGMSSHTVWNRLYLARIAKRIHFALGKYAQDMMYNYQIAEVLEEENLFQQELPYYAYYYRTRPDNITSLGIWQDIDALNHLKTLCEQWKDSHPEWCKQVMKRRVYFGVESNSRLQLNPKWRDLRYRPELDLRDISDRHVFSNYGKRFFLTFLILKYIPVIWRNYMIRKLFAYRGMQYVI